MRDSRVDVVPLGGLGEFGMNMMTIACGDVLVIIDAGVMFPEAEFLGVDLITPDFTYLQQNQQRLRALVLTHGH
ncbi:MAG: ribonuclease J, partial [Acidimicrobiia bacterium]